MLMHQTQLPRLQLSRVFLILLYLEHRPQTCTYFTAFFNQSEYTRSDPEPLNDTSTGDELKH